MTCDLEIEVKVDGFTFDLVPNLVKKRQIFLDILYGNHLAYARPSVKRDIIIYVYVLIFQAGV